MKLPQSVILKRVHCKRFGKEHNLTSKHINFFNNVYLLSLGLRHLILTLCFRAI